MSDDGTTNPGIEDEANLATGAELDDGVDHTTDDDLETSTEDLGDQTTEDDDTEEFEFEGKNYKAPKVLRDAVLRQADYTRKTQELAAEREAARNSHAQREQSIAERLQAATQADEAVSKVTDAKVNLGLLDQQIQALRDLDWTTLDASTSGYYDRALRKLEQDRTGLVAAVSQAETDAQQARSAALTKMTEAQQAEINRGVSALVSDPDVKLTQDKFTALQGWLEKQGVPRQVSRQALATPAFIKIALKAQRADVLEPQLKLLKKQGASAGVQPGRSVGAARAPVQARTTDASGDRMATSAWFKAEQDRMDRKNAANRKQRYGAR